MNLLIVGGTGQVGRATTDAALAAGHTVTAFGRSAAKLDARPGLTPHAGDVLEPEDVHRAVAGHDAVVATFGAPLNLDTITHVPDVTTRGTEHILTAMREHGVDRLVCMTMIGAGDSRGHGRAVFSNFFRPVILGRITADRERQEERVRASGTQWTIVRPTELKEGSLTGDYRVYEDLDGVTAAQITRADVGDYLVRAVGDKATVGRTYLITE